MGNLTLTTQQLNSSMSNDAWEVKHQELWGHATLLLNRDLVTKDSWDEECIVNRSHWAADVVSQVWPGPDSLAWQGGIVETVATRAALGTCLTNGTAALKPWGKGG